MEARDMCVMGNRQLRMGNAHDPFGLSLALLEYVLVLELGSHFCGDVIEVDCMWCCVYWTLKVVLLMVDGCRL